MLFYTPTTYPDQVTAQEVRHGLGSALTYTTTWAHLGSPPRPVGDVSEGMVSRVGPKTPLEFTSFTSGSAR
jgi:hypothetical protein